MKRKVLFAGVLFLALGVIGLLSQKATSQDRDNREGAVLTGVWFWQNSLDFFYPGASIPAFLAFHNDGTSTGAWGIAFGGLPTPYVTSTTNPIYGVWERTGPHEFRGTWWTMRFDRATGILAGIVRARANFAFAGDFDHFAGTVHMDFLPCTGGNPLYCPNPLLAKDTDWVAWSPFFPADYNIKAARMSSVPYDK
jgi:hypothetical protein